MSGAAVARKMMPWPWEPRLGLRYAFPCRARKDTSWEKLCRGTVKGRCGATFLLARRL